MQKKFDAKWYLEKNPDVAASGIDPLLHYQQFGAKEGRRAIPPTLLERLFVRAKVAISVARSVAKRDGGLFQLFKLSYKIFRRAGLIGLKIRIVNHHYSMRVGERISYSKWRELNEIKFTHERESALNKITSADIAPKISIAMATYNTPEIFLHKVIKSVLGQSYTSWELCIADDCSTNLSVLSILKKYEIQDSRIKVCARKSNGNISEATNSAVEISTGSYVAFLDHDDELHQDALLYVAIEILNNPDVGLIYTDEDKVDENGVRSDPYFKCDFNYELMLTQNMICHLTVYKRKLIASIGGFRKLFDGAQDYDFSLRAIEKLDSEQIIHIPRVLYHWRIHSNSTASNINAKPYAILAGQKAVQEHLNRINQCAIVKPHPDVPFWNRIVFSLPNNLPSIDIIIPTRDRIELMRMCIGSILSKTTYKNYRITIVDNGSKEPESLNQFKKWAEDKRISILRDDSPFNYSKLNNSTANASPCDFVCLLNNDIEIITPNWLEEMISLASRPGVGCVGARLWYPDNKLQHGGVILGIGGVAGHSHKYFNKGKVGYFGRAVSLQAFSCVTAAALLVNKSIYQEVSGLDENLQVAFNDVDFCLRVRSAGYRNIWTPFAEMYHHESASRGHEDNPEKIKRFHREIEFMKNRWGTALLSDPYYSPNLTLVHEDFSYSDKGNNVEMNLK